MDRSESITLPIHSSSLPAAAADGLDGDGGAGGLDGDGGADGLDGDEDEVAVL